MDSELKEMSKDQKVISLAVSFNFFQKKFTSDLNDVIWDESFFDQMQKMILESKIHETVWSDTSEIAPIIRHWFYCVVNSEDEWDSLAKLREKMPVREWYNSHYLKSKLWNGLKTVVLNIDQHTCNLCSNTGTLVHHGAYEQFIMTGLDIRFLWTLCGKCHHFIEFDGKRKLGIYESSAKFEKHYKAKFANKEQQSHG